MRKWFSKLSNAVRPAAPSAPVAQQESLEERRLFASSLAYGINANSITKSNYDHVVKMLRDTGSKSVRCWVSIYNWNKSESGVFKYVRKFAADGFDVTASVVPHMKGNSEEIRSYFNWIGDTLGNAVDRFQVGNEIDKDMGNVTAYVTDMLRPAAAGLHAAGEKVVSGAVSWNPDDVRKMANAGMLNYVDFVGYHPYRNNVAQLKDAVAQVKEIAKGKPLVATEWNVRGHNGNNAEWQAAIKEYWPTIRDNFYAAYYFAAIKINSMAGPSGVITSSGSQNGGFYSTFKSLGNNFSGGGTVTPTQPDDDDEVTTPTTPTTPGNTPSAGSKPSIGSFRLFDGVTGQVIKGYENVTSGQTIKLADLPHTKIQVRAMTSSNAKSVKFSFSGQKARTENNAPFTAFANSRGVEAAWQAVKGSYTLSAIAYNQQFAKGTASATLSLVLKFV